MAKLKRPKQVRRRSSKLADALAEIENLRVELGSVRGELDQLKRASDNNLERKDQQIANLLVRVRRIPKPQTLMRVLSALSLLDEHDLKEVHDKAIELSRVHTTAGEENSILRREPGSA